jgi:hypothetical protein
MWMRESGLIKRLTPLKIKMKIRNSLLTVAGLIGAAACSHGQVNIFSDAGDEVVFSGATSTLVDPIPDPLTGSGWGVMSDSGLDGDAVRIWNTGSGRAYIEYNAPTAFTSGVEFNFEAIIESDSSGQYLFRIGAAGGNWASLGESAVEIRFNNAGNVRVRVDGTQTFDDTSVGLDTRFSVSVLLNAAQVGGSALDYDKFGITGSLDPQSYSVFVNGSQVGVYAMQNTSADIGGFLITTGTGSNQTVPTMQFDNIQAVAATADPTWAGYKIDENGDVDTGAWLSWINASKDHPWVFLYDLNNYIYLPESHVSEQGGWLYIPN